MTHIDWSWTLADLREANIKRQIEWKGAGGADLDLLFRAVEMGGEAGEALNVVKKMVREQRGWRGSRATVEDLAGEIADTVITADLLAMQAGIDLTAAVERRFNDKSREADLNVFIAKPTLTDQKRTPMHCPTCLGNGEVDTRHTFGNGWDMPVRCETCLGSRKIIAESVP